jgi:hypothetical protein
MNDLLGSPRVKNALQRAFGVSDVDAARPLDGGPSEARVLKIRVGGIPYVLKVEEPAHAAADLPWRAMEIAAGACIAPRLYDLRPQDGVAIMDYLEARSLREHPGAPAAWLAELGQTVRFLHQAPPVSDGEDYIERLGRLLEAAKAWLSGSALENVAFSQAVIERVYRNIDPELVFSHGDLNPRNVIYDGRRFWIIDWQAACLADRYVDLAALANFYTDGEDQAKGLLGGYFGRPATAQEHDRLVVARQLSHLFYGAALLLQSRPSSTLDQLEGASLVDLQDRMAMGDPLFDSALGGADYARAHLLAAWRGVRSAAFETTCGALGAQAA